MNGIYSPKHKTEHSKARRKLGWRRKHLVVLPLTSAWVILALFVVNIWWLKPSIEQLRKENGDWLTRIARSCGSSRKLENPLNLHPFRPVVVDNPDAFTVMINTYKRKKYLLRSIQHYAKCSNVQAIRVVWGENRHPPILEENPEYFPHSVQVEFVVARRDSLNERFNIQKPVNTSALFSVDDDVYVPCKGLSKGFEAWKREPWQIAGYFPRIHSTDAETPGCRYEYKSKAETFWLYRKYSMLLTKAAFIHVDYFNIYTQHMHKSIRQYVDMVSNCEDIAMQFLVSNLTGSPPQLIQAFGVLDVGQGEGISSAKHHNAVRSLCLSDLASFYGGMPLRSRDLDYSHHDFLPLMLSPIVDFLFSL